MQRVDQFCFYDFTLNSFIFWKREIKMKKRKSFLPLPTRESTELFRRANLDRLNRKRPLPSERERERDIVKKDSLRRKRVDLRSKKEKEIRERRRIRLRWRLWKCASSNKTTTKNLRG